MSITLELCFTGDLPVYLTFAGLKDRGIPFSRQHIGRLEAAGQLPARVQLGACSVGWIENEVEDWIHSRPRADLAAGTRTAAQIARAPG